MTITAEGTAAPAGQAPPERRYPATLDESMMLFQLELPEVAKNKTADGETRTGRQFSYDYADLADVSQVTLIRLAALGVNYRCKIRSTAEGTFFVYELRHIYGETDGGEIRLRDAMDSQAIGSACTYLRRYMLCAMSGVHPKGEDDDAAAAQAAGARIGGRPESAGEAFQNATPAEGNRPRRNGQQDTQQQAGNRAAVPVDLPPLAGDDTWRERIADIKTRDEGVSLYSEVSKMHADGEIDAARATLLKAHITAKATNLTADRGSTPDPDPVLTGAEDPWLEPPSGQHPLDSSPPAQNHRIRPEDQGAPKPAAPAAGDEDQAWIDDFAARAAAADTGDQLTAMQREISPAMRDGKIRPTTCKPLSDLLAERRKAIRSATA